MANKPKLYRPSHKRIFGWEIYGWHCFFITISPGQFEIQINKWPKQKKEK